MTDEQFNELRAIQLAQLALLESIETNVSTLTGSILSKNNAGAASGPKAVHYNWMNAKKLKESAEKVK